MTQQIIHTAGGTPITLIPSDNGSVSFVRVEVLFGGQVLRGRVDSLMDLGRAPFESWQGAAAVRAKGGTHAARFMPVNERDLGQPEQASILALTAEGADAIQAAEAAAAAALAARLADKEATSRARAEAACPAGCVVARRAFDATNLWDDRVVTADGASLLGSYATASSEPRFAYVAADRAAAVGAVQRAQAAEAAERDEAEAAELIPAEAQAAWARYAGSAEAAWEAEDERAWALIRRHYAIGIEPRDRRFRAPRTLGSGWYGNEGDVA